MVGVDKFFIHFVNKMLDYKSLSSVQYLGQFNFMIIYIYKVEEKKVFNDNTVQNVVISYASRWLYH